MNNIIESYTIPRLYKLLVIPVLFGIIIVGVFVIRDFQSGSLTLIDYLFLIGSIWCFWKGFKTTYKVMIYHEHIRCINLIGSIEVQKKDIISIMHGIRSYKIRHKKGMIIITSLIGGFEEFTKWVDPKSNIEICRRI
jgi:hypothetical protein